MTSRRQQRAALIARLRTEGRTRVEIADQLRAAYGVNARVGLRWASGWSQRDAADEWCRHWPDDLKTAKNISYWETWPHSGHTPSLGTLGKLARIYRCDVADLLVDLPGYRHLDADDNTGRPHTAPAAEPAATRNAPVRDGDVAGLLQEPRTGDPVEQPRLPEANTVVLRAMSDAFRAADRRAGGGLLYSSVVRYLSHEVAPSLLASMGGDQQGEMLAGAASLMDAAGWMAHDGGRDDQARRHLTKAFQLASAAGDPSLQANVCASMSHLAHQLGQGADAVRLAGEGLMRASHADTPGRLVAKLYAMKALGHAEQGDAEASLHAIDAATVAIDGHDADGSKWVTPFDEASLALETALCMRDLGRSPDAERHARRAIRLRHGDRARSRVFAQVTLAHVLLDAGEIDEAVGIGTALCEAVSGLASARATDRVVGLGDRLATQNAGQEVGGFLSSVAAIRTRDRQPAVDQWPI